MRGAVIKPFAQKDEFNRTGFQDDLTGVQATHMEHHLCPDLEWPLSVKLEFSSQYFHLYKWKDGCPFPHPNPQKNVGQKGGSV